jgi:hypothetical protein
MGYKKNPKQAFLVRNALTSALQSWQPFVDVSMFGTELI